MLRIFRLLSRYFVATSDSDSTAWKHDWLYLLIFKDAEKLWTLYQPDRGRKQWPYALVEEWSSCTNCRCSGNMLRAWKLDKTGLKRISWVEYMWHQRKLRVNGEKGN